MPSEQRSIWSAAARTGLLASALHRRSRPEPFFFFYGVYPSINLVSTGAHSVFNASYAFGLNRTETGNKPSFELSLRVDKALKFAIAELEDSVCRKDSRTDDAATFDAFRGVSSATDDFRFVFNPVALRRASQQQQRKPWRGLHH